MRCLQGMRLSYTFNYPYVNYPYTLRAHMRNEILTAISFLDVEVHKPFTKVQVYGEGNLIPRKHLISRMSPESAQALHKSPNFGCNFPGSLYPLGL